MRIIQTPLVYLVANRNNGEEIIINLAQIIRIRPWWNSQENKQYAVVHTIDNEAITLNCTMKEFLAVLETDRYHK